MKEPVFAIVEEDGEVILYIGNSFEDINGFSKGQARKINLPWYEILDRISDSQEFSSIQEYFIKGEVIAIYEWNPLTETPFEENELEKIINKDKNE